MPTKQETFNLLGNIGQELAKRGGGSLSGGTETNLGTTVGKYNPTVLSSTSITDKVIPNLKSKADKLPGGIIEETKKEETDYEPDLSLTGESKVEDDPFLKQQMSLLDQQKKLLDQNAQQEISGVQNRINALMGEQRAINQANTAGVRGALMRGGSNQFRYSPGGAFGGVAAEATAGVRNLADLASQESQAISQIKTAASGNDFRLMEQKFNLLEQVRQERQAAAAAITASIQEQQEKQTEGVNTVAKDAAKNGAPATVIEAISQARTIPEALSAAGEWLQTSTGEAGDYLFYKREAIKNGQVPVSPDEYFALKDQEDMVGGLSKDQNTALNRLKSDMRLDPDIKNFVDVRDGYERVQVGANANNAQGDLSLLFGYMKMLDPTSVVRETEFANAEQAQGVLQRVMNLPDKYIAGERLTEEARKHFAKSAQDLYDQKKKSYDNASTYYGEEAATYGIPEERLVRDLSSTLIDKENEAKNKVIEMGKTDESVRAVTTEFFTDYPEATYQDLLEVLGVGGSVSMNRPQRNNNPLNIKASDATLSYSGVSGKDPKPATDGGQFLVFESPEAGFDAAKKLLKTSGYINLSLDEAMKRWSGGGYGSEVLPRLKGKTIKQLTDDELQALIEAMASREGFYA